MKKLRKTPICQGIPTLSCQHLNVRNNLIPKGKIGKIIQFPFFVLSGIVLLLCFSQCQKEDSIPGDPIFITIPSDEYNVSGYRLVMDSIHCYGAGDQGNGSEYYGYVLAKPDYELGYVATEEELEKEEGGALMWFRQPLHFIRLKKGETYLLDTYCDFLFNKNSDGKANIVIESWFIEDDDNSTVWVTPNTSRDLEKKSKSFVVENLTNGQTWEIRHDIQSTFEVGLFFHFEEIKMNEGYVFPDGVGPGEEFDLTNTLPGTPTPATYESIIPKSERWVVAQSWAEKLFPSPIKVSTSSLNAFWYEGESVLSYDDAVKFVSDSELTVPVFKKIFDIGDHEKNPRCLVEFDGDVPSMVEAPTVTGPKLENVPFIQVVQYWKPLNIWRMPAGASKTFIVKTTSGWEVQEGWELGLSLTYSCGFLGFGDFSTTMNTTFSHDFSYYESKEYEETFSYTAPEDKNVVYIVWQLMTEFRISGADGKIFQDPNYEFRSMTVAQIASEEVIEKAYVFDAN